MDFNNSIMIDTYSKSANKQFGDMQNRLSEIESSFQTRMNGKTTGRIVISLIGSITWLAAFVVCAYYVRDMVDNIQLLIALAVVGVLILFMMIDTIMDFSYYGKISSYKNSISQLQRRVSVGKNSISSNQGAFIASRTKGWDYLLNAAPSIPEEATSAEMTMANMESLKKGFINGAKNVFFYATAISIAVVGSLALFNTGSHLITEITGESISSDTLMAFNVIALIVTVIAEIILAKLVWSKTDCNVTNITMFIVVLGPIMFITLIAITTFAVLIVMWIIGVVLSILAVVAVGASVFAATSGS